MLSRVEQIAFEKTVMQPIYPPTEKIRTIIVENFPSLGKLAALRFLEWTQQNPGWTISLPTGKTPEHFIQWVSYCLENWNKKKVQKMLEEGGVDPSKKPNMKSFHFIQIDEFYPIDSSQHNSFFYYVNKYYLDGFGLDPAKALLINCNEIGLKDGEGLKDFWPENVVDLSLRIRPPRSMLEERQKRMLEAVDQFSTNYEERIRELGGIGFFLGGIGPDGHIGFNVRGSDHFSTTRLCETNYETQAAAAVDLGGIEISRNRLVITIGLQTITYCPDTTAVIIAAGETKAYNIKAAVETEKSNQVPASALQALSNAAFYVTRGAAKLLTERRHFELSGKSKPDECDKYRLIIDVALNLQKKLGIITRDDIKTHRSGEYFLKHLDEKLPELLNRIENEFKARINNAMVPVKDQVFLHTAPHHDDIMLGYLPYLVRLMREQSNQHFFNYLTSGFNAVTNSFMLQHTLNAEAFLQTNDFHQMVKENYFAAENALYRNRDVLQYLDGLAAENTTWIHEGEARRFLRCLNELYEIKTLETFKGKLNWLSKYFKTQYPGKKDIGEVQRLKGMLREWEADVLWGYFGFQSESVIHSRLGFYKGDIFTEEPSIDRDVLPIVETLKKVRPTIVTVALDPEGSGPDTHYKVLQAISSALKIYQNDTGQSNIKIWGYRNVWYRYHPAEANFYVPVTFNGMAILNNSFLNSFRSQAEASFPSYEYDGPFSGLAKHIHVTQYQYMKTMLGRDFFYNNSDSRIRSTRGLVYLTIMELDEFYKKSRELRKTIENH